jgi:hypothetical protein
MPSSKLDKSTPADGNLPVTQTHKGPGKAAAHG